MQPVWKSKELLGIRGDVIVERDVAEAFDCDEDHQNENQTTTEKELVKNLQETGIGGRTHGAGLGAENSGGGTSGAGRCAENFSVQTRLPKHAPKQAPEEQHES